MKLYRVVAFLIAFYFSLFQAFCGTWTLGENQIFRTKYYKKSLDVSYGVTHDFGNDVRIRVEKIDLGKLYARHKDKLETIKSAMDNRRFSWTLAGLPLSGKSTLLEILSQLLEKPLVSTDDFFEYSVIEFKNIFLPQTVADIQNCREQNPKKSVRDVLKDRGYYNGLREQKVNEAILFAHTNNFILDAGGQETSTNEASRKLLKALGIKVVYLRFASGNAYSEYVFKQPEEERRLRKNLIHVTKEILVEEFYKKRDPLYMACADRTIERYENESIEGLLVRLIDLLLCLASSSSN